MEWVIPAVLVVLLLCGAVIGRRLTLLRATAIAAWPELEGKLRRRHDLAAHLAKALETLPAGQQRSVQAMLKACKAATLAELSPERAGKAEMALGAAIGVVVTMVATQPELQGEARLRRLLPLLEAMEREITEAADAFNHAAHAYNLHCFRMPGAVVASVMNLFRMEYFGLESENGASFPDTPRQGGAEQTQLMP